MTDKTPAQQYVAALDTANLILAAKDMAEEVGEIILDSVPEKEAAIVYMSFNYILIEMCTRLLVADAREEMNNQ